MKSDLKNDIKNKMICELDDSFFTEFPGENRLDFPECIVRVTGGAGGEALLILGSEKTALYDTGMACFYENLLHNIDVALEGTGRSLDYILTSHTHYDHIGALPYVLDRWPNAKVCGNLKASKVFASEGAIATMERLGNKAKEQYHKDGVTITARGMRVDRIVKDGDEISLGDITIKVYETPGHTDCSLSYMLMPGKILISCESTGLLRGPGRINTAPVKSLAQCIESTERLKKLDYDCLILPHYGVCPSSYRYQFFDDYLAEQKRERDLILDGIKAGLSQEEILEKHKEAYWTEARAKAQPYAAYQLNTEIIIKQLAAK